MSEYFIIHNIDKKEIIDAQSIGLPVNLEAVIGDIPANLLAYLLTTNESKEQRFEGKKNTFKGRWKGDKIEIIGDQQNSKEFIETMTNVKDITETVYSEYEGSGINPNMIKIEEI